MVNSDAFIQRMEIILAHYGLSAASFAEKLGVQRSGISHLLSGRNKPSLEFVMKLTATFPEVDLYWLLNGKGNFPAPVVRQAARAEQDRDSPALPNDGAIDKIIIFYKDGSYETYSKARN